MNITDERQLLTQALEQLRDSRRTIALMRSVSRRDDLDAHYSELIAILEFEGRRIQADILTDEERCAPTQREPGMVVTALDELKHALSIALDNEPSVNSEESYRLYLEWEESVAGLKLEIARLRGAPRLEICRLLDEHAKAVAALGES